MLSSQTRAVCQHCCCHRSQLFFVCFSRFLLAFQDTLLHFGVPHFKIIQRQIYTSLYTLYILMLHSKVIVHSRVTTLSDRKLRQDVYIIIIITETNCYSLDAVFRFREEHCWSASWLGCPTLFHSFFFGVWHRQFSNSTYIACSFSFFGRQNMLNLLV